MSVRVATFIRSSLGLACICVVSTVLSQSEPRRQPIQDFPLNVKKSSDSDPSGGSKVEPKVTALEDKLSKLTEALQQSDQENRALRKRVTDVEQNQNRKTPTHEPTTPSDKVREERDRLAQTNKKLEAVLREWEHDETVSAAPSQTLEPTTPDITTAELPLQEIDPIQQGNGLLERGDAQSALEAFQQALEEDDQSLDAQVGTATSYFHLGQNAMALALCKKVLKEDRNRPDALALSGMIAVQDGDLKTARKQLGRAVKEAPENAHVHAYLGVVQYRSKRLRSARKHLEKAVTLNPEDAESFFNLAILDSAMHSPNWNGARRHYQKAVELGATRDLAFEEALQ